MVNKEVLNKIESKLEQIIIDPTKFIKGIELLELLQTCYKSEFEFVTKDISKVLKNKEKKHKKILDNLNDFKIKEQLVILDGKEVKLLSLVKINNIFVGNPYPNIKTMFCLIPENLILLSLGEENEIS